MVPRDCSYSRPSIVCHIQNRGMHAKPACQTFSVDHSRIVQYIPPDYAETSGVQGTLLDGSFCYVPKLRAPKPRQNVILPGFQSKTPSGERMESPCLYSFQVVRRLDSCTVVCFGVSSKVQKADSRYSFTQSVSRTVFDKYVFLDDVGHSYESRRRL